MKKISFGTWGVVVGGLALMLALVHFWAGPFSPQPSLETLVSEKAASIRQATLDALKGEPKRSSVTVRYDADKITQIVTAVLGGLALILAALSFSKHESRRAAGSAAALGLGAITFQFIAMYAMALLVVLLIVAVLSSLGGG